MGQDFHTGSARAYLFTETVGSLFAAPGQMRVGMHPHCPETSVPAHHTTMSMSMFGESALHVFTCSSTWQTSQLSVFPQHIVYLTCFLNPKP